MIKVFSRDLVRNFFHDNPCNTRFNTNIKKLFGHFCAARCRYRTSFKQSLAQEVILNNNQPLN